MDGLIDFCQKYPAVAVILGILVVILIISKGRTVVYNGLWETKRGKAYTYTDRLTGTTFLSQTRILMPGALSGRRQKFGKTPLSVPLTILWLAVIVIMIYSLS